MQSIQQMVTSVPQMADSATSVARALTKPRVARPAESTGSTNKSNSAAADTSSTITANDFLTLLVAEMKNQDPTQPTDPNAYISQMVDVNSLQQLIGINQGITTLDSSVGATTSPASGASS